MKIKDLVLKEAPFDAEQEQDFLDKVFNKPLDGDFDSIFHTYQQEVGRRAKDAVKLGSGMRAVVIGSEQADNVIRLGRNDQGALRYLTWCLQHQDNPHVPQIRTLHNRGGWVYANMEKLAEVPEDYVFTKADFPWLLYLHYVDSNVVSERILVGLYKQVFPSSAKSAIDMNEVNALLSSPRGQKIIARGKASPMGEVIAFLGENVDGGLDIRIDDAFVTNMMYRPSTRSLVVTDPFYH